MSHFSWTRASYVMFALAVIAALIKLWNPDLSAQKPLAAEPRPDAEALPNSRPAESPATDIQGLLLRDG
ncbi:MAG: hypothetical protein M3157_03125 [Actinomycetota bacterium]|nr:hypothetical protein [Actinomycetota bacterium]